jgi:hypothetical protein
MELPGPPRPRVSRETRLLLATILISTAALWALARVRFPDRPATPNPVPPLLTQLAEFPGFDDLATEMSMLGSRLLPSLVVVELPASAAAAALRVTDDVAAALGATSTEPARVRGIGHPMLLARDAASGLVLMRVPGAPAPMLTAWAPQRLERPRYLFASQASPQGASLRPVFVGRLHGIASPAWAAEIWLLPGRTDVEPGEFLFTIDGALAGLVIAHEGMLALVPGGVVLNAAERLLAQKATEPGWLGVDVQALTPATAAAAGSRAGVMVVWVDPEGPAAGKLSVMDVIEAAGGDAIASPADWQARVARLAPSDSILLRVRRRGGDAIEAALVAEARPEPSGPLPLGLTLRTIGRVGAAVIQVAHGSAAAGAGLREGDVITAIGDIQTPTARQVTRSFAAARTDRPVLVAITRGDERHVLALDKR